MPVTCVASEITRGLEWGTDWRLAVREEWTEVGLPTLVTGNSVLLELQDPNDDVLDFNGSKSTLETRSKARLDPSSMRLNMRISERFTGFKV